jgi:hypothetical protein
LIISSLKVVFGQILGTENENNNDIDTDDKVRGPDLFQNAEIYLPHGDRFKIAKVIGRKQNADGNYTGRSHKQPKLDSRIFIVQFPDGDEKDFAYNILAEHLYSQLDSEGNQHQFFNGIINHKKTVTHSIKLISTVSTTVSARKRKPPLGGISKSNGKMDPHRGYL